MNDITLQSNAPLGAISKYFAQLPVPADLSAGIQASYGVIGYKGKVWSLRYRGDIKPLIRADGSGPLSSIEVIVISAPAHLSKIYYETGYTEGSNAPPDCFSNNAVAPDPSSRKIQNPVCATCRHNVWGSRVMQQAGRQSQGKACSDSKRLAVVPLGDIQNEAYGGPMLLRVPPASLQDLAMYGSALSKFGYPYFAVGTRISFDMKEAFPKFLFTAIRALNDGEAEQVIELQKQDIIDRILAETGVAGEAGEVAPEQPRTSTFEQGAQPTPAQTTQPDTVQGAAQAYTVQQQQPQQAQPTPQSQPQPQPQSQPQPQPVQQPQPVVQATQTPQITQEQVEAYLRDQAARKAAAEAAANPQPQHQPVQQQAQPQVQEQPQIRTNGEDRQQEAGPQTPAGWGDTTAIEQELDEKLKGLLAQR